MTAPLVTPETTLAELHAMLARVGLRLYCYPEAQVRACATPEIARERHDLLAAIRSALVRCASGAQEAGL